MTMKKFLLWGMGMLVSAGLAMAETKTPVEQIGESLRDNRGKAVKSEELKDKKLVAYYFSASWCPPCRKFTPELVKFYKENNKDMEIVLISRDTDEKAQLKYMRDYRMPWKTLAWGSAEGEALVEQYQIQGIPSLVVVDANGNEITRQGVREVYQNPKTVAEEWAKKVK